MAKVRARSDNSLLFMDFYYRGERCREQTALKDTHENRRRVQSLLNRISKAIKDGTFDYAATFPTSPRIRHFVQQSLPVVDRTASANQRIATPEALTPTFSEFSTLWRGEMAPQWRRLHRESVDAIFAAHLLPAFGAMRLSQICKADVLAFRSKLAAMPRRDGKGLAPVTINKIMTILTQCLTEASERFELLNPCKGIKRLRARRPDVEPFSLEEVSLIRSSIRDDFRNYITTRFFTGMRTGEINGLKWKYVDFDRRLILVRGTFAAGKADEDAKTESSLRDIPMLPAVEEALRDQLQHRHPDSEYVFTGRDGNPIDAHNFTSRIWYPLLRYLGIVQRRPYQTRHTTATLMLASGENPEWIARLMGHANTQMLFTVYSRFVPNLTRQDGLAIAGLLTRATTPPLNESNAKTASVDGQPKQRTSAGKIGDLTLEQIDQLDAATLRDLLRFEIANKIKRVQTNKNLGG